MKAFNLLIIPAIVSLFFIFGCAHSYNSMVDSGVNIELKGDGKYQILGDTEAKAEIYQLFGFVIGKDSKKTGSFPGIFSLFSGYGKTICEQAAAYKAIENFEGADQIINPKFKTEEMNYIVYAEYSTTLKAKAVKIVK